MSLWALVVAGALVAMPACGKRGPPLPPLRPVPDVVNSLTIHRRADAVVLRFLPPTRNQDGSEPLAFDHVEIFAVTLAADAPPPSEAQLRVDAHRIATLTPTATPAITALQFVDSVPASDDVRYYEVVPFATRRRGGVGSPILIVPLGTVPAAPVGADITYDQNTMTLTWTAATDATGYLVYRTGEETPLPATPLKEPTFSTPVVFGTPVCFTVRAVQGTPPVLIESAPSAEVCRTPVDTFPPAAPAGLVALASPGAITLTWDAVTAADLAGYLVLRGEGSGDRLQPLMAAPLTETSFTDRTAVAGVRYFYEVVAVDTATPANRSTPSNRVEETGR
jgi:hypothetical protein